MESGNTPDPADEGMVQVERPNAQKEFQQQVERLQDMAEDVNEKVITFVRERPGLCIAGALAVGYLVGRVAARRWLR